MSAIATMTVVGLAHSDGVTTRNHTFAKEANVTNGIKLRDTGESDYSLAPRLTFTAKPPTATSKIIRIKTTMTIPYKDPVTGLLAGTITRTTEDLVPASCPGNVRKDAVASFTSLTGHASFLPILRDLDFAS